MSNIYIPFICVIGIYASYRIFDYIQYMIHRFLIYSKYDVLSKIVDYNKETAYLEIFKSDILINITSGFAIRTKELQEYQTKYLKRFVDLCGPNIIDDLEILHGNIDSVLKTIAIEFVTKVKIDEDKFLNEMRERKNFELDEDSIYENASN